MKSFSLPLQPLEQVLYCTSKNFCIVPTAIFSHWWEEENFFLTETTCLWYKIKLASVAKTKLRDLLNTKENQNAMPEVGGLRTGPAERRGNTEVSYTNSFILCILLGCPLVTWPWSARYGREDKPGHTSRSQHKCKPALRCHYKKNEMSADGKGSWNR